MTKKSVKRWRHTDESKAEAVRLVESRGDRTVAEIAQSLGIAESLLRNNVDEADSCAPLGGGRGLNQCGRERTIVLGHAVVSVGLVVALF
jgi:transposase-like protein